MKYVVGRTSRLLGNEFNTRYTNCKCIDADSEASAIAQYGDYSYSQIHPLTCIGMVDENNSLIIYDYSKKYRIVHPLPLASSKEHHYLVSKLLHKPKNLSVFSFYIPKFIRAKSANEAIQLYAASSVDSNFEICCLGYLDTNDTFTIPNVFDFIE